MFDFDDASSILFTDVCLCLIILTGDRASDGLLFFGEDDLLFLDCLGEELFLDLVGDENSFVRFRHLK